MVSLGVLALLLTLVPWGKVWDAVTRMTAPLFAGALGVFLGAHYLGALKWRTMLTSSLGGQRLRTSDMIGCYGTGLFANLFLPTVVGGDVVRAGLAARTLGRPEAVVLGSVADRLIDVAALALLVGGGVIMAGTEWSTASAPLVGLGALLAAGLGLLALPFVLRRPLSAWPPRYRRPIGRSLVALRHLARRPLPAVRSLALALAMQGTFILLAAQLGAAVGAHAPTWVWFVAWPLAKAVGMLPISLGGLGVRDAALASLLVPFGVPMTAGLAAALAWSAVLVAGALAGGLIGLLLRPQARKHAVEAPPLPHAPHPIRPA